MTSYIIRAALAEEANEGWVWLETKRPSRSVVKIKDCVTKHTVFCQIRKLDGNFIKKYNKNPSTINITNSSKTIVMSEWYRDALGGFPTTYKSKNKKEERAGDQAGLYLRLALAARSLPPSGLGHAAWYTARRAGSLARDSGPDIGPHISCGGWIASSRRAPSRSC